MQTFRNKLEEIYIGKRVKIIVGHIDNKQFILATVGGFDDAKYDENEPFYIILNDISAPPCYDETGYDSNQWLEYPVKSGQFKRHYFRLSTFIEIID